MNVGPFSRKGKSRTKTEAADHDFKPEATLTPFGIFLPEYDDLTLYMTGSKVTSDFIVDRLGDWWEFNRVRFPGVTKLVLNLDNGPENHSRRTQFLKRMVGFAREYRLDIELAYYPPYHSKYNPIERCWGILELHWNGALLDSVEAVLGYAETMTLEGWASRGRAGRGGVPHGGAAGPGGDGGVGVERSPACPHWRSGSSPSRGGRRRDGRVSFFQTPNQKLCTRG